MRALTLNDAYPFDEERAEAASPGAVDLGSMVVLWPVVTCIFRVLGALAWAALRAVPQPFLLRRRTSKTPVVEYIHQDTATNRALRASLEGHVAYDPTPWLVTGDVCTLAPFALFGSLKVGYKRKWLRVGAAPAPDGPEGFARCASGLADDEACALDIREPPVRLRDEVYLVLHGLNGGSHEPYVEDFVFAATEDRGATAVVLVARGLMQTPVRGAELFHGARTSDVGTAVRTVKALYPGRPVILVGFSMGGIIAANYAARAGAEAGIAGCVAVAAVLSCAKTLTANGDRSRALWQPFLALSLKETFLTPTNLPKLARRQVPLGPILEAPTIDKFDKALVCAYHGYADLRAYYEDMSAAGGGDARGLARMGNLAVPLLLLNAKDDPITTYQACLAPEVAQASPHVFVYATARGGHVGWPQGLRPTLRRWALISDVAFAFADVVAAPVPSKK